MARKLCASDLLITSNQNFSEPSRPMHPILNKLRFMKLQEFIKKEIGVDCPCERTYIFCNKPVPKFERSRNLSVADILSLTLDLACESDQIKNGYSNTVKKWYYPNTTRNLLRTPYWRTIFDAVGDACSIFILTKCTIVEETRNGLVLVCGHLHDIFTKKDTKPSIVREHLFIGNHKLELLDLESFCKDVFHGIENYKEVKSYAAGRIREVVESYNRLPLRAIFRSFFNRMPTTPRVQGGHSKKQENRSLTRAGLPNPSPSFPSPGNGTPATSLTAQASYSCRDIPAGPANGPSAGGAISGGLLDRSEPAHDQQAHAGSQSFSRYEIGYDRVIDFLFLISKKCLRPVLRYSDLKILKGKLALLVKRNVYEGISREELKKYFSLPKLKLFRGNFSRHEYGVRCTIAERFLTHLMDAMYIRIVSYFFYSTVRTNTRYRVSYFSRTDWNTWTTVFYKEFLRDFEPATSKARMGTFRCIPKPDGFRVVTNCSKIVSTGRAGPSALRPIRNEINRRYQKKPGSINSFLAPLLPILHYESKGKLNSSLVTYHGMYRGLYGYLSGTAERQYLFKLDVSKCFNNLPHEELLELTRGLLRRQTYYYSEYMVLRENQMTGGFETRYVRRAGVTVHPMDCSGCDRCALFGDWIDNAHSLPGRAPDPADSFRRCIIKEYRHRRYEQGELLRMAADLISNMVVCHQNQFYNFNKGIPQGCCISSILCSLYYAMLDEKHFKDIFKQGAMWRYIDDFLIITPSVDEIKEFIRKAEALKKKGLLFNWAKAETNMDRGLVNNIMRHSNVELGLEDEKALGLTASAVDASEHRHLSYNSDSVVWCGLRIFDRGVGIKSMMGEEYFRYCTCLPSGNPGRRIFAKIRQAFQIKTSPILISYKNRKLGENVYDIFYFIARRVRIFFLRADFQNPKYIASILDWCVLEMKRVMRYRKIAFDPEKVDSIARKAYEKLSLPHIARPPWR